MSSPERPSKYSRIKKIIEVLSDTDSLDDMEERVFSKVPPFKKPKKVPEDTYSDKEIEAAMASLPSSVFKGSSKKRQRSSSEEIPTTKRLKLAQDSSYSEKKPDRKFGVQANRERKKSTKDPAIDNPQSTKSKSDKTDEPSTHTSNDKQEDTIPSWAMNDYDYSDTGFTLNLDFAETSPDKSDEDPFHIFPTVAKEVLPVALKPQTPARPSYSEPSFKTKSEELKPVSTAPKEPAKIEDSRLWFEELEDDAAFDKFFSSVEIV